MFHMPYFSPPSFIVWFVWIMLYIHIPLSLLPHTTATVITTCINTVGTESNALVVEQGAEFTCSCGSATCTLSTGMYCISSRSSCFFFKSSALENVSLRQVKNKFKVGANVSAEFIQLFSDSVTWFSTEWKTGSCQTIDTVSMSTWDVLDADENTNGPSTWSVVSNELIQTSNIDGPAGTSKDWQGTVAASGESSWTDYIVEVKVRSDEIGRTGVAFRVSGNANYYAFVVYPECGASRLIKVEDGTR